MLPDFLVGSYRQYKENTKVIATWLASTARAHGYTSEAIPSVAEVSEKLSKSKLKSKPKTKKQKRDAARRIPKEQRGKFVIALDEFLPLAKYISTNLKPPSRVPSSILSIIRRVIEARKDSDDWFKANTKEDDKDGHIHFVRILQEVYDTLQPFSSADDGNDPNTTDNATDIENVYKNLQLEEPSREFLDSPAVPGPDRKGVRMLCEFVDVFMEHVGSYFEESFAASSLFRDVNKIYRHVELVWQNHKDGKVDLMTAAIVSNTAIDLIRRLEEDFFEQFPRFRKVEEHILQGIKKYDPKHTDAQQLTNFMFRAKCASKKKTFWNENTSEAYFNLELYEDARYVFLDMHALFLEYFIGSQKMDKCVYQSPPGLGLWDPDTDYDNMTSLEKHRQDRRILLELLPDVILLCTSTSKIASLGEDELLRGSRNFYVLPGKHTPTIHLWMMVSLRLFCDIHHILGPNIGKPFEAIRRLGTEATNSINQCIKLRDAGKTQIWPAEADESIELNILKRIQQSLFVDEVKEFIDNAARNVKWWKGKKDFELLRRHPWACGLMEFNIHVSMQEAGLVALDQSDSGVTAAHLYNALQKQDVLNTLWPDMEMFMELVGDERVFRGQRPTSLEDCSSRLSVMRGISAKTFAQNRRDRGILLSKHGRYSLFPKSDLIQILKSRCVNVVHHFNIADDESAAMLESLEEVLNKQVHLTSDGTQVTVRDRGDKKPVSTLKKDVRQERKYNPVELLMSLQFGLARELPGISFDYLAFHKSCWEVLNIVYDTFGPLIEAKMPPVFSIIQEYDKLRVVACVDILFSLGVPFSKAMKMIRKVAMPVLPPMTHEYQQMLNHRAILSVIGDAINNRLANGRMRIPTNVRARKQIDARPEVIYFEVQAVGAGDSHRTINKRKLWVHKDANCTRTHCVCGTKPIPMFKSSWKQNITENADKWLSRKLDATKLAEKGGTA